MGRGAGGSAVPEACRCPPTVGAGAAPGERGCIRVREIGERLRHERMARAVSLEWIREETKISMRYLEALENGEFEKLPGEPYLTGFIRLYARAVGCDPEPILERYQELRSEEAAELEPVQPAPQRRRTFLTRLSETLQWLGL